jgi:hypothetical protein
MSKKVAPKSPKTSTPVPQLPPKKYEEYFDQTSPSVIEQKANPIMDFTDEAPAPSQTYYNLCVYPFQKIVKKQRLQNEDKKLVLNRDKMKAGCVVLRHVFSNKGLAKKENVSKLESRGDS